MVVSGSATGGASVSTRAAQIRVYVSSDKPPRENTPSGGGSSTKKPFIKVEVVGAPPATISGGSYKGQTVEQAVQTLEQQRKRSISSEIQANRQSLAQARTLGERQAIVQNLRQRIAQLNIVSAAEKAKLTGKQLTTKYGFVINPYTDTNRIIEEYSQTNLPPNISTPEGEGYAPPILEDRRVVPSQQAVRQEPEVRRVPLFSQQASQEQYRKYIAPTVRRIQELNRRGEKYIATPNIALVGTNLRVRRITASEIKEKLKGSKSPTVRVASEAIPTTPLGVVTTAASLYGIGKVATSFPTVAKIVSGGITGYGSYQAVAGKTPEEKATGRINIALGIAPFLIKGGRYLTEREFVYREPVKPSVVTSQTSELALQVGDKQYNIPVFTVTGSREPRYGFTARRLEILSRRIFGLTPNEKVTPYQRARAMYPRTGQRVTITPSAAAASGISPAVQEGNFLIRNLRGEGIVLTTVKRTEARQEPIILSRYRASLRPQRDINKLNRASLQASEEAGLRRIEQINEPSPIRYTLERRENQFVVVAKKGAVQATRTYPKETAFQVGDIVVEDIMKLPKRGVPKSIPKGSRITRGTVSAVQRPLRRLEYEREVGLTGYEESLERMGVVSETKPRVPTKKLREVIPRKAELITGTSKRYEVRLPSPSSDVNRIVGTRPSRTPEQEQALLEKFYGGKENVLKAKASAGLKVVKALKPRPRSITQIYGKQSTKAFPIGVGASVTSASAYAGKGLYERTEGGQVPVENVEITTGQVKPLEVSKVRDFLVESSISKSVPKEVTKEITKEVVKEVPREAVKTSAKERVKELLGIATKQASKQSQRFFTGAPKPPTETFVPPKPSKTIVPKIPSSLLARVKRAYDVITFKEGKEMVIGRRLPEGKAKKLGVLTALRTLRASFKLRPRGTTAQEDISYSIPETFRPSKRDPTRFVQLLQTRLKARSEVKEIIAIPKRRMKGARKFKWF